MSPNYPRNGSFGWVVVGPVGKKMAILWARPLWCLSLNACLARPRTQFPTLSPGYSCPIILPPPGMPVWWAWHIIIVCLITETTMKQSAATAQTIESIEIAIASAKLTPHLWVIPPPLNQFELNAHGLQLHVCRWNKCNIDMHIYSRFVFACNKNIKVQSRDIFLFFKYILGNSMSLLSVLRYKSIYFD